MFWSKTYFWPRLQLHLGYSVAVLGIWLKFWRMMPMGVKDNHTKNEQETQQWRSAMGVASGRPGFENLQFRAKNSLFFGPKQP